MLELFTSDNFEQNISILQARMEQLRQLLALGLTDDDMNDIAQLSESQLQQAYQKYRHNQAVEPPALVRLYKAMQVQDGKEISEKRREALWEFDSLQNDYLNLLALATTNEPDLFGQLKHLAIFYQVFVRPLPEEDEDINIETLKKSWQEWIKKRPELSQKLAPSGLFEAFQNQTLQAEEWLTDLDLEQALDFLALKTSSSVHICSLDATAIGSILHIEKQGHSATNSYEIPFILNVGSGNDILSSTGLHWVRMWVKVNPSTTPTSIEVDYIDESALSHEKITDIKKIIRDAITYQKNAENLSETDEQAFPGSDVRIKIEATGKQRDGYSCGYRALQGFIQDLANKGRELTPAQETISQCDNVEDLHDACYRLIIGQRCITEGGQYQIQDALMEPVGQRPDGKFLYQVKHDIIETFLSQRRQKDLPKPLSVSDALKIQQAENAAGLEALQTDKQLSINLAKLKAELDPTYWLMIAFRRIGNNATLETLSIEPGDLNLQEIQQELGFQLDDLLSKNIQITSEDLTIQSIINATKHRHQMLNLSHCDARTRWDTFFEKQWFDLPDDKAIDITFIFDKNLGQFGLTQFLKFLGKHQSDFKKAYFSYETFKIEPDPEQIERYVNALVTHFSSGSYFPTQHIILSIDSLSKLTPDILYEWLNCFDGLIEIEMAQSPTDDEISQLMQLSSPIKATLKLTPTGDNKSDKLVALENHIIQQKRNSDSTAVKFEAPPPLPPEQYGPLARAVFNESSVHVDVQTQMQEQVQQQVQQQVQAPVDDNLPDINEADGDIYPVYTGDDALLDEDAFYREMQTFMQANQISSSGTAWKYIVGEHHSLFKYGIQKLTRSAAKVLLLNLDQLNDGFHPDNLPHGFTLQRDANDDDKLVLGYAPLNARSNPNTSPLTPSITKIKQQRTPWVGDIYQFIKPDQATSLFKVFQSNTKKRKGKKPTLEQCVKNFFYLNEHSKEIYTAKTMLPVFAELMHLVSGFDKNDVMEKMQQVFGQALDKERPEKALIDLGCADIEKMVHILYENGPHAVMNFLEQMVLLKKSLGDDAFIAFRTGFIEQAIDLNGLMTSDAQKAIDKIRAYSPEKKKLWTQLIRLHSSNELLRYSDSDGVFDLDPFRPKILHLVDLVEAFDYFCQQLAILGLSLPADSPILFDLQVGLDRLLTILTQAMDPEEQLEHLKGLVLNALGPFYAVRYEGFRMVSPEMNLRLGWLTNNAFVDKSFAASDSCFRTAVPWLLRDKFYNLLGTAHFSTITSSMILRNMALHNHRAPLNDYAELIKLILEQVSIDCINQTDLLIILMVTGGSKHSQHLDYESLQAIFKSFPVDNNHEAAITKSLKRFITFLSLHVNYDDPNDVKISFTEVITLLKLFLEVKEESLSSSYKVIDIVKKYRQTYLDSLLLLKQNPSPLAFDSFTPELLSFLTSLSKYSVHLLHELPQNTTSFAYNYLLIKQNDESVLYYVKPNGALETINDVDFDNLETEVKALKQSDEPIAFFLKQQIFEHIRHTPDIPFFMTEDNKPLIFPIVKLFMLSDGSALQNEETCRKKIPALFHVVQTFDGQFGRERTTQLLILLGHINLKADKLPTIDDIIGLIGKISRVTDYNELEAVVEQSLPQGCSLSFDKDYAFNQPKLVNFSALLNDVLSEFFNDPLVRMVLNEDRRETLKDYLNKARNPKQLITLIDELSTEFALDSNYKVLLENKIMDCFKTFYSKNKEKLIKALNYSDKRLKKVLKDSLTDELPSSETQSNTSSQANHLETQFQYLQEKYSQLKALMAGIQTCLDNHPQSHTDIVNRLDAVKEQLKAYDFALLTEIFNSLNNTFKTAIPLDLLEHFLSFSDPQKGDRNAIMAVIKEVLEAEDFTLTEKAQLASQALILAQNEQDYSRWILNVRDLKKAHSPAFDTVLQLLEKGFSPDEIPGYLETLQQLAPGNSAEVVAFLKSRSIDDSRAFLNSLCYSQTHDNAPQSLRILLKFTSQEEDITDLYEQLLHRSPDELDAIAHFRAVQSKDLREFAESGKLPSEGDSATRTNEDLKLHFSTDAVNDYINQLKQLHLNGQPRPAAKRYELQQWFLYLNYIGHKGLVALNPNKPASDAKCIKDMTGTQLRQLLGYCRERLANEHSPNHQQTQLIVLAILREAMYRATGKFPRPTQMLYLLGALQAGKHFIGQVQTGEGKSMISALMAAFLQLQGKTVDVCTVNKPLAEGGFKANQPFFEFLDIPARLITANAAEDDYQKGQIHYACLSELALYQNRTELYGKEFNSENASLILDEIDYTLLDDRTNYRFAKALNHNDKPYDTELQWIYKSLIDWYDAMAMDPRPLKTAQYEKTLDALLLQSAQNHLIAQASTPQQYKHLEAYASNIERWIQAAGASKALMAQEGKRFRIEVLPHPQDAEQTISKACILDNGRPNTESEYGHAVQQFLHLRLRAKYKEGIDKHERPDFLIETEKQTVSMTNAHLMMNVYGEHYGLTGTAGSQEELKSLNATYGFHIMNIPPFVPSKRQDLSPIWTNPKLLDDETREEQDHLNKIVKEVKRYRKKSQGPILILCADNKKGERIKKAILEALPKHAQHTQTYYGDVGKDQEHIERKAGETHSITISTTVLGRGADIVPKDSKGLFTIRTYVDTAASSNEDLLRKQRQEIGRSARQGMHGQTRTIVKRREFLPAYQNDKRALKRLQSSADLQDATTRLNDIRNALRSKERAQKQAIDNIFKHIQDTLRDLANRALTEQQRKKYEAYQRELHDSLDAEKQKLLSSSMGLEDKLEAFKKFAEKWCKERGISIKWPKELLKRPEKSQFHGSNAAPIAVPPSSERNAYLAMSRNDNNDKVRECMADAAKDKIDTLLNGLIKKFFGSSQNKPTLFSGATFNNKKLGPRFKVDTKATIEEKLEKIIGACLYLSYNVFKRDVPKRYYEMQQAISTLITAAYQLIPDDLAPDAKLRKQDEIFKPIRAAFQGHFNQLTKHHGSDEARKAIYLRKFMTKGIADMPRQMNIWKRDDNQATWVEQFKEVHQSWLHRYKTHWWARSWVSPDRKEVARQVFEALEAARSYSELLASIKSAKEKILEDDTARNRDITSGLEGRLYRYLDTMEQQVIAASDTTTLDGNLEDQLALTLRELQQFDTRVKWGDFAVAFQQLSSKQDIKHQFKKIITFLDNIARVTSLDKRSKSDNWQLLQDYCRQKGRFLIGYSNQCYDNQLLRTDLPMVHYRVASEIAASLPEVFVKAKPKSTYFGNSNLVILDNSETTFSVQSKTESLRKSAVFFAPSHQKANYQDLLKKIKTHYQQILGKEYQVEINSFNFEADENTSNLRCELQMTYWNFKEESMEKTKLLASYDIDLKTGSIRIVDDKPGEDIAPPAL